MTARRMRSNDNRQARTLALQILFETDLTGHALNDVVRRHTEDLSLPQTVRHYLERLMIGVVKHQEQIDEIIADAAPAFPVSQLPVVDRNILRIAIYELHHEPDVPLKAAINEAVELAKQYGGDNSSRFVNGVLGTVARSARTRSEDVD